MNQLANNVLVQAGLEPKLISQILTVGRLKSVKSGELVVSPTNQGNEMPIVLSGLLKVMREDNDSREVFLYYLEGGETCAMSITCCLEGRKTEFKVKAEEDSDLWMTPISYLDEWVTEFKSFRKYVFGSYQARFDELLNTIDSVVFSNMDQRLFKYLLDTKQATGSYQINKTHQEIADELGSSRVVVSRLLKQLEKEQKIEQHRNRIEIM